MGRYCNPSLFRGADKNQKKSAAKPFFRSSGCVLLSSDGWVPLFDLWVPGLLRGSPESLIESLSLLPKAHKSII